MSEALEHRCQGIPVSALSLVPKELSLKSHISVWWVQDSGSPCPSQTLL